MITLLQAFSKYAILCIAVMAFIGCKDNTTNPTDNGNSTAPSLNPADYALTGGAGTTFVYDYSATITDMNGRTTTFTGTQTVIIEELNVVLWNGLKATKLSSFSVIQGRRIDGPVQYSVASADKLSNYTDSTYPANHLLMAPIAVNAKFASTGPGDTTTYLSVDETVTVPAGNFRCLHTLRETGTPGISSTKAEGWYYAGGAGLAKSRTTMINSISGVGQTTQVITTELRSIDKK
jgi:hypothetical protein